MSARLTGRALLRLERLRWQTGWANDLRSTARGPRLRVLKALVGVVTISAALVWLAVRTVESLAGGAPLPPGAADAAAGLALLLSLLLAMDGMRAGAARADRRERWLAAVGVPVETLADRSLAAAVARTLPICWVPLLALAGAMGPATPAAPLLLSLLGVAFALGGQAFGVTLRRAGAAARRAGVVAVAAVAALVLAGLVASAAGETGPPWIGDALALPWGTLSREPWIWSTPAIAGAALWLTRRAILADLLRDGILNPASRGAAAARHRTPDLHAPRWRTLLETEARRLTRRSVHDAVAIGFLAVATVAMLYVRTLRPDGGGGMVTAQGGASLAFIGLLLPAAVVAELVWGRDRLRLWIYARAGSAGPSAVLFAQVALAFALLAGWGVFVAAVVGLVRMDAGGVPLLFASASAAAAGFTGGGAAGAAAALAVRASEGGTGHLIRYAGLVLGGSLPVLAYRVSASPSLAAAVGVALLLAGAWAAVAALVRAQAVVQHS